MEVLPEQQNYPLNNAFRAKLTIVAIVLAVLAKCANVYFEYDYFEQKEEVQVASEAFHDKNEQASIGPASWDFVSAHVSSIRSYRFKKWLALISLVAALTFCAWQYRAAWNLRRVQLQRMEYSPEWSISWWFIPLANFWKPLAALKELYKGSMAINGQIDAEQWKKPRSIPLVNWWFGVFLLHQLLVVGFWTMFVDSTQSALEFALQHTSEVLTLLIAAILCIKAILRINQMQHHYDMWHGSINPRVSGYYPVTHTPAGYRPTEQEPPTT